MSNGLGGIVNWKSTAIDVMSSLRHNVYGMIRVGVLLKVGTYVVLQVAILQLGIVMDDLRLLIILLGLGW